MSIEVISVIGLGYIGLPTAAMFASKNKKVIGVDINKDIIKIINDGQVHFVEPELRSPVHQQLWPKLKATLLLNQLMPL